MKTHDMLYRNKKTVQVVGSLKCVAYLVLSFCFDSCKTINNYLFSFFNERGEIV